MNKNILKFKKMSDLQPDNNHYIMVTHGKKSFVIRSEDYKPRLRDWQDINWAYYDDEYTFLENSKREKMSHIAS